MLNYIKAKQKSLEKNQGMSKLQFAHSLHLYDRLERSKKEYLIARQQIRIFGKAEKSYVWSLHTDNRYPGSRADI